MELSVLKYSDGENLFNEDGVHVGFIEEMDAEDMIMGFYFCNFDHGGQSTTCLSFITPYILKIANKEWPEEFDGAWYLVVGLLENYQIIDSGVSVRVPWLTPRGELLLQDLKTLERINEEIRQAEELDLGETGGYHDTY